VSVSYVVKPGHPEAHEFEVVLNATHLDPAGTLFQLPNWIPGSYMIRDFSKNILTIEAQSDGKPVVLTKKDKSSWLAPAGLEHISLSYRVYAWDLSVRAAHLDNEHGFFNGTSVFLSVAGQENQAVSVMLQAPDGEPFRQWRLATSLNAVKVNPSGFGEYSAANYDELIDHPVEMGTFERIEFDACGVPHEVILTGEFHTDNDRIAQDLKTICEAQIRFFGEPAPVERYVFLVMVVGDGYGGLEHRASTALMVTRDNLPRALQSRVLSYLERKAHKTSQVYPVRT